MDMKHCPKCNQIKKLSEFNKNKRKKDGLQIQCRKCTREFGRKHYKNNKEYYYNRNRRRTKEAREYIYNAFKNGKCIDCGEKHLACLQFDHVTGNKHGCVSQMVTWGIDAIKREIEKCVIRCANCHAKKTAKELNWYADLGE